MHVDADSYYHMKYLHKQGDSVAPSSTTKPSSLSLGSSVSLGSLVGEFAPSIPSEFGGDDESDELELGYLVWPCRENVGVMGVEHSEPLDGAES